MIESEEETDPPRKACAPTYLCGMPRDFAKKANVANRTHG